MTHTPPSEAAASSPFLSPAYLRTAAANRDGDFSEPVRVLAAEILRMRAQCPPTAEVEQMRSDLERLRDERKSEVATAVEVLRKAGVITRSLTSGPAPDAKVGEPMTLADTIGMLCRERASVIADRDAWKHKAYSLGGDLNRIRSLVPTASDEQSTFDAVFNRLQNLRAENEKQSYALRENGELHLHLHNIDSALRDAGRPHRHKGDELERIRDLAGERDGHRDEVERLRAENERYVRCIDAIKEPALPAEAQSAVAAIRDLGPELAKAGIQVGPRCSHAEAVAQLRGERDRWRERFEAADKEYGATARQILAMCDRLAGAGFDWTGAKSNAAGLCNAVHEALAELNRLRKESKRDQVAKQQALIDEIARLFPGNGPLLERVRAAAKVVEQDAIARGWLDAMRKTEPKRDVALAPIREAVDEAIRKVVQQASKDGGLPPFGDPFGLFARRSCKEPKAEPLPFTGSDLLPSDATKRKRLVEELRQVVNRNSIEHACGDTPDFILAEVMADAAFAFGRFTRGRDAHSTGRAPKVAPATGQTRTEAPIGPDGRGTVVELGEAFRRNLANAVDCLPGDGHHLDSNTIRIAIRNLHAAIGDLAKVVERGGAK